MSEYASLTVAQLKEKLKAKGLATDGKKADLVSRLTESDSGDVAAEAETKTEEPATEPEQPEAEKSEPKEEEAIAETAVDAPAAEEKPEKKTLGPEERKQLAVELLTKKIKRAEKFGDEASAQAARKDLARVEKFGVDAGTALAKEIGYLDRSINGELKTDKSRVSKKKKN